jgi:hypothetical protein
MNSLENYPLTLDGVILTLLNAKGEGDTYSIRVADILAKK